MIILCSTKERMERYYILHAISIAVKRKRVELRMCEKRLNAIRLWSSHIDTYQP